MLQDDTDILTIVAQHPDSKGCVRETMGFERVRQDRRIYYRMLVDGNGSGSLTTAKGARETIAYWRVKGWVVE